MLSSHTKFMDSIIHYRDYTCINIHVMNGARMSLAPDFFQQMKEQSPGITLNITDLSNEGCFNNLEQDIADFIIAIPFEKKKDFCYHTLKKEGIKIILPKNHPLSDKKELTLYELSGFPLVMYSDTTSTTFLDYCTSKNIHFSDITFVHDILSVYQFSSSESKIGISLNGISGKIVYNNLIEIPLSTKALTWNINLIYKEKVRDSAVIRDFIKKLLSIH